MTVGLPGRGLGAVSSLFKTLWIKLRPIWVGSAPSSACPAIFPLVNKSSFFLEGLLPEIGVNGALLIMVDEVKEGGLFRWNAILLAVGLSKRQIAYIGYLFELQTSKPLPNLTTNQKHLQLPQRTWVLVTFSMTVLRHD